jgi:hypothetical protein
MKDEVAWWHSSASHNDHMKDIFVWYEEQRWSEIRSDVLRQEEEFGDATAGIIERQDRKMTKLTLVEAYNTGFKVLKGQLRRK